MGNVKLWLSVCFAVLVGACGGSSSKGAACVAPSGVWSLELKSTACGDSTIKEDFTKLDSSDNCVLAAQEFDDKGCVFMQGAQCEGYDVTSVFTLNARGDKLTGTTTVENADGSVCDFDVTGAK